MPPRPRAVVGRLLGRLPPGTAPQAGNAGAGGGHAPCV